MNRGTQAADIKLASALSLSGMVKSGTVAVAGAYVSLYNELDSEAAPGTVSTSKGRFTFDGLVPGRYTLFGAHPDFNINRLFVNLAAGGERVLTAEALVPVLGHGVDEARKPVAGGRVVLNVFPRPGPLPPPPPPPPPTPPSTP